MVLVVNGERRTARLSLGALAEVEEALEVPCLVALVERFESNRFSSLDVLHLLAAGLQAGGARDYNCVFWPRTDSGRADGGCAGRRRAGRPGVSGQRMTVRIGMDWPALMRAGLNGLGLTPAEFWALTPAELQLMLGLTEARAPLLRDGLAALMAAYPDRAERNDDDR